MTLNASPDIVQVISDALTKMIFDATQIISNAVQMISNALQISNAVKVILRLGYCANDFFCSANDNLLCENNI